MSKNTEKNYDNNNHGIMVRMLFLKKQPIHNQNMGSYVP